MTGVNRIIRGSLTRSWTDLTFVFRSLLRARLFAISAVAILALCFTFNATMFLVVRELLVPALHVREPGRLAFVTGLGDYGHYRDFAATASALIEDSAAVSSRTARLRIAFEAVDVPFESVSTDYFETLGVGMRTGRPIIPTDTRADELVAVISESLWRRQFDAASTSTQGSFRSAWARAFATTASSVL